MVAKPTRKAFLGFLVAVAAASGLLAVSGMLALSKGSAPPTAIEGSINEAPDSRSTGAAAPRRRLLSVPVAADVPDGPTRANGEAPARSSATVLDIMSRADPTAPKGARSPESKTNELSGPIALIIQSIRTTDPEALGVLREQLAD